MNKSSTSELKLEPVVVNATALNQLQTHMQHDFPPLERIPFGRLKRAFRKGYLQAFWLTGPEGPIGYIVYHVIGGLRLAHIMYFAIVPQHRGGGVGSRALQLFRREMDGLGVLLEVEDPEKARGVDERLERDRRVEFYQRNGFDLVPGARLDFFSVPMAVMADREVQVEDWEKLYRVVYHRMLGAWLPTVLIRQAARPAENLPPAHAWH